MEYTINKIISKDSNELCHKELIGTPKALLPTLSGKKIIDYWWNVVNTRQLFSEVYLVTNADKYKHFERWATANDFPVENIINDGSTTIETSLGSVADFGLALQNKHVQDDVMVVAGDMLFEDQNCDIAQVVKYFKHKKGELVIYYELEKTEDQGTRGIVEVDSNTNRVKKFYEKPTDGQTNSLLASVVFYCFRNVSLAMVNTYLELNLKTNLRSFGKYMEWLINETDTVVYGMKLPTRFQLIGQVTLDDYEKWVTYFKLKQTQEHTQKPMTCRTYARVGLMGNPSDGFGGKTISMSIGNFWASATIQESEKLELVPHPLNDPTTFGSLFDLHGISQKEGYLGGLRLLQATCKKFYQYCSDKGIALCKKNFTLSYDTNIPRQVGLAGSSAIVTATLQCLLRFFNLSETDMPKPIRAQFILGVETDELYINAGLQDRVVQVYEGLVYMDFSKNLMDAQGYGNYEYLPCNSLPEFWLAYNADPSDSGKIHSDVRKRFDAGDEVVKAAIKEFADLTVKAKNCVTENDWESFASLMDQNFDLRKRIYGAECLGKQNLEMIEIARKYSSSAKFPGSGGAVVGICQDEAKKVLLRKELQANGFVYCDLVPICQQ